MMNISSLGWQSWSPIAPSWPPLPYWDYNPLNIVEATTPVKPIYPSKPPISLWCSWHNNGTNINEKLILEQATKFESHKFVPQYILIDDGWCTWGDWMTPSPSKFPSSIKTLISKLKDLDYQGGLWMAPFLVSPNSNILSLHPNWLIKNKNGSLFNGFSSYPMIKNLTPKYLLDFTRNDVMNYIIKCLDTIVLDWGVSLLKLDHLYAPYFAPDSNIANQVPSALNSIFTHLQKSHPNVYTIACGCPFDVAQYAVDSIRISKDINSPQLNSIKILNNILYFNRKKLMYRKLDIAKQLTPLPFGIDPDAAINRQDAEEYHKLWKSGIIQVFGLGYDL